MWRHLKALNDLYSRGKTSAAILDNGFIQYLKKTKRLITLKPGSEKNILPCAGYHPYYEQHFKAQFQVYLDFMTANGIDSSAKNYFDEYDLNAFIFIVANKNEIQSKLTTIRHFSSLVFREKGSKYLEKNSSIARIVCKLLDIDSFPGQDPTVNGWRCVVDHPKPNFVILCENLANLKLPWIAQQHALELWYVGGNNISIVNNISQDKLQKPIYYCCDWDFAGLEIYTRLAKLLSDKSCILHLLEPANKLVKLNVDSPDHYSKWDRQLSYSGLNIQAFTERQLILINELIAEDKWIEEESQDLVELIHFNQIIFQKS